MMRAIKVLFSFLFLSGLAVLLMGAKMSTVVPLQKSVEISSIRLDDVIQKRRSVRNFYNKPLNLKQISLLLWAAQGITNKKLGLRAAPSAGALYPLSCYVVKKDGVWLYVASEHILKLFSTNDMRANLSKAALSQRAIVSAPVSIVIAGNYAKTTVKYGERGSRYVQMEAGHVAQNILLKVQALGVGAVAIGAFDDNAVRKALRLPDAQTPLYIIPVGYEKRR